MLSYETSISVATELMDSTVLGLRSNLQKRDEEPYKPFRMEYGSVASQFFKIYVNLNKLSGWLILTFFISQATVVSKH